MLSTQLNEIIADKALVSSKTDREMILEEKNVMKVAVTQMPSDVTVVDMDRVGHLPGVKDGELKQICDYLLVCECKDTDHAIFVELKKTLKENKKGMEGMEQLRRSLPILKYLHSACQIHYYEAKTNRPTPAVRYFLIGTKNSSRIDKQRVRPQLGVEKEKYEDIEVHTFLGERIRFDLLLNGEMGK